MHRFTYRPARNRSQRGDQNPPLEVNLWSLDTMRSRTQNACARLTRFSCPANLCDPRAFRYWLLSERAPFRCRHFHRRSGERCGLCFIRGASLPDPHKILVGSGTQTRFMRVGSAKELARPEVEGLITSAIAISKVPLPATGARKLVIRSVSKKQRPRRKRK
jgi:hypothetical protein